MKALVYHGPGHKAWDDVPDATIQDPTDVVVRVETTTICGTDLHILQGDVAAVTDGRILGHEAVGTITAVGDAVSGFARRRPRAGARRSPSAAAASTASAACPRTARPSAASAGSSATSSTAPRPSSCACPYADTSLYAVPEGVTDEQAIFLADSLPTGYEVGVLAGGVRPGDTVAVVGAGAVGLSADPHHRACGARRR